MNSSVKKMHLKSKLVSLFVLIFVYGICTFIYNTLLKINIREEKSRYEYIAANESFYIINCIDKVVVRTYTLRELIVENNGSTAFFDKMGPVVYQTVKDDTKISLRNLGIAPDGKITKVYPLLHNESLVGFDYTDEQKPGNKEALEAFLKERTIITNPFELVQGGIGMAARTPVFLEKNGKRTFWGLVTATMDFGDTLRAFNLDNLINMDIDYCLWYENADRQKVEIAKEGNIDEDCISIKFQVYNLNWHLDLKPEDGWYSENLQVLGRITIIALSILFAAITLLMFRVKHDGERMKNLAEKDSLTQVYSRHYLNSSILDIKTGNWKNKKAKYSVVMIDLDHFKEINDSYGHNIGDRTLMTVTEVLRNVADSLSDTKIVRFGGDEFLMFIDGISRKELGIMLHTIITRVGEIRFDDVPDMRASVSIGGVSYETAEEKSYASMIKEADERLYEVKESGRNNYSLK